MARRWSQRESAKFQAEPKSKSFIVALIKTVSLVKSSAELALSPLRHPQTS
jgi:hypothetical protein